jgi:hypothetical protein
VVVNRTVDNKICGGGSHCRFPSFYIIIISLNTLYRDHLGDLGKNGRIILKKQNEMCTGFILVNTRPRDGFSSGSIKDTDFLDHPADY